MDDVALLSAVLQQDLLERYVEEARKERGGEDPEDIRPVHGWQKRLGGCVEELRVEDAHSPSSTTSGWSLLCLMSCCREWGQE